MKRHAVAAQMKSPLAWVTSCLRTSSPGHSDPRVHSSLIIPRECSKKREISWLIIAGGMWWRTKFWCSLCGIARMLCRIGTSGLLVKKTRSLTVGNDRASARSRRIVRTWPSLSHSSSASITRRKEDGDKGLSSFTNFNGRMTSSRHCSERDRFAISLRSLTISQICVWRDGTASASCTARLVTNLPAWLTSPPPLEKKKLAPRRFCSLNLRATVREIVDFPVPARPFSQKISRSSCPSFPSAQSYISCSRPRRVLGRQAGSSWRPYELKGASSAYGR